jgi:hypothetical protein
MQELIDERLVAYRSVSGGTLPLPPVWDGGTIQMLHEWRVTPAGRRDALLFTQAQEAESALDVERSEQSSRDDAGGGVVAANHDVFVSHASEDKDAVARQIATRLRDLGYRVWYDEFELRLGTSLRRSIDKGLAGSRYGVVILSPAFLAKEWPQRELDGLAARETADGRHLILPVWHAIGQSEIAAYSPVLADRKAVKTEDGLDTVVAEIASAIGPPSPSGTPALDHADVKLSPVPSRVELRPMLVGGQIVRLLDGTFEAVFDLDRVARGPGRRRAAELFDDLRDRADILGEIGFADRERWAEELTDEVKGLLEDGVALMGGNYERQLEHSTRSESWPGAVLQAIPLAEAQQPHEPAHVMPIADATEIALTHVLIDKGDTTSAEERLRPLAERGNPHAALLLGMLLRDGNDSADAADWLGRAAEAGLAEALTHSGCCCMSLVVLMKQRRC